MKKGLLLSILAVMFLSVLCYNYVTDYSSLTTDSGFDSSYSGGSSGGSFGGSSGGYSGSSSSSYHSHRNTINTSDPVKNYTPKEMRLFMLILMAFIFPVTYLYILLLKRSWQDKKKYMFRTLPFLGIWLFWGLVFPNPASPTLAILLSIVCLFIYAFKYCHQATPKEEHITYPELSVEDKELVDECYKVFCDVQIAWMEFDYDKMRNLVTDELFNQYQNQLKQLELKGEKNVMTDFAYLGAKIVRNVQENGERVLDLIMSVEFYDYIINQDQEVVRGRDNYKMTMTYELTYIADEEANNVCPNCAAKLSDSMTKCPYCKSTIHSTRKTLKLASKHAID